MLRLVSLSALLTAARLLGAAAALFTTLILTHQFGAEIAASFAVCTALAATLATLGLAGTHAFAPVLTAEYSSKQQYGLLRGFVGLAGGAAVALTALLALLVLGAHQFGVLDAFGFHAEPAVLGAAAIIAVCITVSSFSGGILSGRHKQPKAQLPESLLRPILVLIVTGSLALLGASQGSGQLLALIAGAFVVTATLTGYFLLKELRGLPTEPRGYDGKRWRYMAPPWLGITLAWDTMIELMLLIAAALMGPTEVVLLYICFRLRMLFGFGLRSIYSITQPKIYEAMARDDKEATRSLIGVTNVLCLVYAGAAMLFLTLAADLLLGLFGSQFTGGKALLLCVCSLMIFRAIFGPGMALLATAGKHYQIATILLISLVFALVSAPLLFQAWGPIAFGIAYTAANASASVGLWWLARSVTGIDSGIWTARGSLGGVRAVASWLDSRKPEISKG